MPTRFPAEIIALDEGDRVVGAVVAPDESSLVMVTAAGQLLRTPAAKIRPQGRTAAGVAGMKVDAEDGVLYFDRALDGENLVVATAQGVKVTPVMEYPEKGRGTAGVRCVKLRVAEDAIEHVRVAAPADLVAFAGKAAIALPAAARRDASTTPTSAVTALLLARPRPSE